MELKYVLDQMALEPIMLIDKHIGFDDEMGEGIMGDQFVRELMYLDSLGKRCIQIWINSVGGAVTDGEQIYHAILKSVTPVDTYNTGTAASIAAPLFLAGRRRYMMDYAKIMVHPVSGGDKKSLKAFDSTISTMLSARSFLSAEKAQDLMNKTTWILADEALNLGLCTEVELSDKHNRPRNLGVDAPLKEEWKEYARVTNKLIESIKPNLNMKKITNLLNLNDAASEESIVAEITKMQNVVTTNEANFKKMEDEYLALKDKFTKMENEYLAMCENKATVEAENAAKKVEMDTVAAKNMVSEFVKIGKVKNEAEAIAKWEAQAIANYDGTKELLDTLPLNKVVPKFDNDTIDAKPYNMAASMAEIRMKNKQNK